MGLFSRLRGERRSLPTVVPAAMWRSLLGSGTASGITVTPDLAMKVAAAWACVTHLSDSIGMLPLAVYQERDAGKTKARAVEHPLYRVIKRRPNRWQTPLEWRRMMSGHLLIRGVAYSRIAGQRRGVDELVPMHPDRVTPFQTDDGDVAYHFQPLRGEGQILLREEVHVWRGFSGDIFTPISPIRQHAETLGLSIAALEHGARLFSNGAVSTGVLQHPKTLSDDAYQRLRNSFAEQYQGLANHHKPILLEEGMQFEKLGLNADELQMLETRVHQIAEVCSIWRMNPLLIGHGDKTSSWGTGVEQIILGHLTFTLSPLLRLIEQSMERDLLSEADQERGFYMRYTDAALLRVDMKAKAEYYKSAIGGNNNPGWMRRNEVRALEDLDWAEGLDEFVMPNAYANAAPQKE